MSVERSALTRALDAIERIGNRLPDPAVLFAVLLLVVLILSAWLATLSFDQLDPRTGAPVIVKNMLQGDNLTPFFAQMVATFVGFHPLGVVLVAMLGIGVADHAGFINAGLKALLAVTAKWLLTPMLITVAIVSHTAADAGYVLVIPLGGVIFMAAGRHPLAGIAAAFAGVSGGFSANFVPSALDPLLAGLTQAAAQLIDPGITINPLNNWFFTMSSSLLIIGVGWFLTDRVIEPRLAATVVDGELAGDAPGGELSQRERRALRWALASILVGIGLLVATAWPAGSPWRSAEGALTASASPLMQAIVPLIFVLFLVPGVVFGYVSGRFSSHRDVIEGMSKSMSAMGYYLVMAFFAAQFIAAFGQSGLGVLLALEGAAWLRESGLPAGATLTGIVLLSGMVNLVVGSASAKWALIAPVFVPMLMQVGLSPDLTQAAYRVGDSTTNIVTPLMPYFPLIVLFCRRYVQSSGIGTVVALMLPYSVALLVLWTAFLLGYWALGLPLGLGAGYGYP
ncbi:MAG: aminobenzoyl-glutamate transporter [Gammaproteobacteria bacterium SG8_30]|nr:MAG: aminobenzoyl-glutamate transporter [Gammaproteobacteria bacterium SG8_30]